jgi:hypothetical protein
MTETDTAGRQTAQAGQQPQVTTDFGLVRGCRLLEIIFPEADSRPSLRSLERYVKRRRIPSIKLGRLRFYSPESVRGALLDQQLPTRTGYR